MRIEINMSYAEGLALAVAAEELDLLLHIGYQEEMTICWIDIPEECIELWRGAKDAMIAELLELGMPRRKVNDLIVRLWDKLTQISTREQSTISRFIKGEV